MRSLLIGALLSVAAPAVGPAELGAQDAPPPLPPASARPTPPAAPATASAPPANAVALCNDQSYILTPALPSACATRGGLKLVLPAYRPNGPQTVAPGSASAALVAPSAPRSAVPPEGATMRCKDGTWLTGPAEASRCSANGGLAAILPPPRPAGPPPRPR